MVGQQARKAEERPGARGTPVRPGSGQSAHPDRNQGPRLARTDKAAEPTTAQQSPTALAQLQKLVGNRVVVALLQPEVAEGPSDVVQLQPEASPAGIATKADETAKEIAPGVHEVQLASGLTIFRVSARGVTTELTASEFARRRAALENDLGRRIARGKDEAQRHKETHKNHLEDVRGFAGVLSDFINDVTPPSPTIWGPTIRAFESAAAALDGGELQLCARSLRLAERWLASDIRDWKTYLGESISGAESLVGTLEVVRDVSASVVAGLATGGLAYGLLGGGALAAAGGAVAGASGFAGTGAALGAVSEESQFGTAVLGTLAEVKAAGVTQNLKLAANGLLGLVVGMGEGFAAMFEGLATLFTDPAKFVEDLAKLPDHIHTLWEHREQVWSYFERLPPEEQAFRVGKFAGNIEAILASIGAANAAGAATAEALGGVSLSVEAGPAMAAAGGSVVPGTVEILAIQTETAALFGDAIAASGTIAMMTGGASDIGAKGTSPASGGKAPPSSAGGSKWTIDRARKLLDDSEGTPGPGSNVGHARAHVPRAGEDAAVLAQARPTKQRNVVYRNERHALQDLRDALGSQAETIDKLTPGQQAYGSSPTRGPRKGYLSELGEVPREVTWTEVIWRVEKMPDGRLHLITFHPKIPQ